MTQFKAGDVVNYRGDGIALIERIDGDRAILTAWRGPTTLWLTGGGSLMLASLKPHPDPEAVWADFVAWRLTQ